MGRTLKTWQPHQDDFERKVPFTDPIQVAYLAGMDRRIFRSELRQNRRDVLTDEVITSIDAIMQLLDGWKREWIEIEDKKRVRKTLEFSRKKIPTMAEIEAAEKKE